MHFGILACQLGFLPGDARTCWWPRGCRRGGWRRRPPAWQPCAPAGRGPSSAPPARTTMALPGLSSRCCIPFEVGLPIWRPALLIRCISVDVDPWNTGWLVLLGTVPFVHSKNIIPSQCRFLIPWPSPGCHTGNGGKLSNSWFDGLTWLCLAAA